MLTKSALLVLATAIAVINAKVANSVIRDLQAEESANIVLRFKSSRVTLDSIDIGVPRSERIAVVSLALKSLAEDTQKSAIDVLTRKGINFTSYYVGNAIYVDGASKELVDELKSLKDVKEIRSPIIIDVPVLIPMDADIAPVTNSTAEWGIDIIGAPLLWSTDAGITGKGSVIASIDTGVRGTHEAVRDNFRKASGWYDPYHGSTFPEDNDGHGSHTMGTMVGRNGIGVAPGAEWIACRGFNRDGKATDEGLLACGQWILCPTDVEGKNADCSKAPHVVSNSWGSKGYDSFYEETIAAWRMAGIIPVFSNGNKGPGCSTQVDQVVSSPGGYPNVIGVGAVGSNTNDPNALAYFSSKGPAFNEVDGVVKPLMKPDLSAPGYMIRSISNISDTEYALMAGTSMAAPHVSGAIGLMKSVNPKLSYDEVYSLLTKFVDTKTLKPEGQWVGKPDGRNCNGVSDLVYPNNAYGYGRLNIANSVRDGILKKPACTTKHA